jgi:hypothetical protein
LYNTLSVFEPIEQESNSFCYSIETVQNGRGRRLEERVLRLSFLIRGKKGMPSWECFETAGLLGLEAEGQASGSLVVSASWRTPGPAIMLTPPVSWLLPQKAR